MFVETHFDVAKDRSTSEEITFMCPQPGCPDQSGNRSVNLKTGLTNCWRCNKGGNFWKWAKGLGYEIPTQDMPTTKDINVLDDMFKVAKQKVWLPKVLLPDGCHRLAENLSSAYAKSIQRMAEDKRLTLEDMVMADVYFNRMNPVWEAFCIFPVKEYGQLVYYQGRAHTIEVEGMPTKRFPSKKMVPYGSSYWVYNIDAARHPNCEVVVVFESILNVLSFNRKLREQGLSNVVPVCVFKHHISKEQLQKLIGCRAKEICIFYDADAVADAKKEATTTLSGFKHVTVAEFPADVIKDHPTLDANDNIELAWECFLKRKPASAIDVVLSSLRI